MYICCKWVIALNKIKVTALSLAEGPTKFLFFLFFNDDELQKAALLEVELKNLSEKKNGIIPNFNTSVETFGIPGFVQ